MTLREIVENLRERDKDLTRKIWALYPQDYNWLTSMPDLTREQRRLMRIRDQIRNAMEDLARLADELESPAGPERIRALRR